MQDFYIENEKMLQSNVEKTQINRYLHCADRRRNSTSLSILSQLVSWFNAITAKILPSISVE